MVNKASILQNQADCVELSEKKIEFKTDLKFLLFQVKENRSYLRRNFEIIKSFIEEETDVMKKSKINTIYTDLLSDVFVRGIFISIEDSPDVFKAIFEGFPDLSQKLVRESNKNLAFYKLYYDLDLTLSTGVEYNRVFSIAEKNIEKLKYQDEESIVELKAFIFENLQNFTRHDCFCAITARELTNRPLCAEIVFK